MKKRISNEENEFPLRHQLKKSLTIDFNTTKRNKKHQNQKNDKIFPK
ncbi:hypothetical protein [Helicobacter pylori]|nr:hypothetical protein [Helicobacter pylori]